MSDPQDSFEHNQPFAKYGVEDQTVVAAGRAVAALHVLHTVPDTKRTESMQMMAFPSNAQRTLLGSKYMLDISTRISNWQATDSVWAERLYNTQKPDRYPLGALAAAAAIEVPIENEVAYYAKRIAAAAQDSQRSPENLYVIPPTPESVRRLLGAFVQRRSPLVVAGYAKEFFNRDVIGDEAVIVNPSDVPADLATATPWMRSMVNAAVSARRESRYHQYAYGDGRDHVLAYAALVIRDAPHG